MHGPTLNMHNIDPWSSDEIWRNTLGSIVSKYTKPNVHHLQHSQSSQYFKRISWEALSALQSHLLRINKITLLNYLYLLLGQTLTFTVLFIAEFLSGECQFGR